MLKLFMFKDNEVSPKNFEICRALKYKMELLFWRDCSNSRYFDTILEHLTYYRPLGI